MTAVLLKFLSNALDIATQSIDADDPSPITASTRFWVSASSRTSTMR